MKLPAVGFRVREKTIVVGDTERETPMSAESPAAIWTLELNPTPSNDTVITGFGLAFGL